MLFLRSAVPAGRRFTAFNRPIDIEPAYGYQPQAPFNRDRPGRDLGRIRTRRNRDANHPRRFLSYNRQTSHPASGIRRRKHFYRTVCPLRRLHEGVPDQRASTGSDRGRFGRDLDTGSNPPNRRMFPELQSMRDGVSNRCHRAV